MRRQSPTLLILLATAVLTTASVGSSAAQTVTSNVTGGNCLVVSRASDPTPGSLTAPSSSFGSVSVVSRQWMEIALASARLWASSFAPAPARHTSVAVRRRAVR